MTKQEMLDKILKVQQKIDKCRVLERNLQNAVLMDIITEEQYRQITGKNYGESEV